MKKNTKLIFLSIEGVLNNLDVLKVNIIYDKDNCRLFQKLIDKTHAKIVIIDNNYCENTKKELRKLFNSFGLKIEIIGHIDECIENKQEYSFLSISEKIENYINSNKKIDFFVILDSEDRNYTSYSLLKNNFIKISIKKGFTSTDLHKCENLLN